VDASLGRAKAWWLDNAPKTSITHPAVILTVSDRVRLLNIQRARRRAGGPPLRDIIPAIAISK